MCSNVSCEYKIRTGLRHSNISSVPKTNTCFLVLAKTLMEREVDSFSDVTYNNSRKTFFETLLVAPALTDLQINVMAKSWG